jgi:predicted transcriptional regulator
MFQHDSSRQIKPFPGWATFKLKPPCSVVVRYLLPSINAHIAIELIGKHGMRKSEVAKKMGVTPAAVTQYLNHTRGDAAIKLINSSEEAVKLIAKIADYLANSKSSMNDVLPSICEVCRIIRVSGLTRKMHKDIMPCVKGRSKCSRRSIKENGRQAEKRLHRR